MKVIILCGGMGTRLGQSTERVPKPLIEIGGKPILWHIMKLYAYQGFTDFILCLGYMGRMIKDYFYNYEIHNSDFTIELGEQGSASIHNRHSEDGWRITLADTGLEAMKGSRIKQVQRYVDGDTFMITYGDGVADIDLHALMAFHNKHGRIGTVSGVQPPSRFGELAIENDRVLSFTEKPQVSGGSINGGFFVFDRRLFNYLSVDQNCDLEIETLDRLAREEELMVYKLPGEWACMDTPRDVAYLNRLWRDKAAFWKKWTD